ncbi:MAG: hypothetical protein CTY10_09985 [Methylotenera sp.]|nr:MAG: hypothetical protein CTY10_09985 [Methylotenera sp.]
MKLATLTMVALMAASSVAQAASIEASSATFAGTVIDFNNFDGYILPQIDSGNLITSLDLGSGVTLTTTPFSVVGQNAFSLEENGIWTVVGNTNRDGNFVSTAFESGNGAINFSFATAIQKVGIFANQSQALGENNSLQVLAYDINGNVLESFTVNIDTAWDGYDEGLFVGFERASADIYGFGISDGSFVVDNLTIAAVPEPETYAMFLAGLGLLGVATRRRA